jgi:hypothetical protein
MPKQEEMRSSLAGTQSQPARVPGAWQAAAIAALSALLFGYWAASADKAVGASAAVSRIADVAPQDVSAALETIAWSPEQLARFREREACGRRLAWVTIAHGPGQPPGRIRLQSGTYTSPAFEITDAPVRVALPYPAPYETGHGAISVIGTTTDAIVALTPPWHVPVQDGLHAQDVTWTPVAGCPTANK